MWRYWCLVEIFCWCLVQILKMKCDQDLCLNFWYDFKKLLWQHELNPRVRCAFGNVFYICNFCFRLPKSMFTRVVVNANYEWMMWQKDHPNIFTQCQSNIFHINNIEQKAWKSGQISSLPKIDIFSWFITVLTSRGGNKLFFSCQYYHGWGQPWLLHQKHLWGPEMYDTPKIWNIFF